MSPREALAEALRLVQPPDPEWVAGIAGDGIPSANWPGWADRMLFVLDALGFTVARTQDARDGEALARLRQAMNPSDGLLLALTSRGVVQASVAVIPAEHRGIGDPVSKAADACRAQLESAAIEATR